MIDYGLSYLNQEEYASRLHQYALKDIEIERINGEQHSFRVGHNLFSSWSDDEY